MGRETDQLRIHAAVYWVALYNIELLISLLCYVPNALNHVNMHGWKVEETNMILVLMMLQYFLVPTKLVLIVKKGT